MHGLVGFWRQVLYLKPSSHMSIQTCQKQGSIRLSTVLLKYQALQKFSEAAQLKDITYVAVMSVPVHTPNLRL